MNRLKIIDFSKSNKKEISYHSILFMIFVFLFWFLFARNSIKDIDAFLKVFLYSMTYSIILIINIHYLFPKYFIKKKYLLFTFLTLLTFQTGYFFQQWIYSDGLNQVIKIYTNFNYSRFLDIVVNTFTFVMLGTVGHFTMLLHKWFKAQKAIAEIENSRLEMELQSLKNQISPHFLFNTLNNLYVLSKTKSDLTSESIMHLSDIIKYQMNSSKKKHVAMIEEIEYLKSLLHLEKIRKDELQVKFNTNIISKDQLIQPMIFSPLIENAIKHGSQKSNNCTINIDIVSNYFSIILMVENSISVNGDNCEIGSGLENLKRRLEISYKNRYELSFKKTSNKFFAKLKIDVV